MPYSRISDTFALDARLLDLGNEAFGVVARCIAFCGGQLTDGKIPKTFAQFVDPSGRIFAALLEREVVVADGTGYRFPNWAEEQRTSQQIAADRERQREKGLKSWEARKSRKTEPAVQPAVQFEPAVQPNLEPAVHGAPRTSSDPIRSNPIQEEEPISSSSLPLADGNGAHPPRAARPKPTNGHVLTMRAAEVAAILASRAPTYFPTAIEPRDLTRGLCIAIEAKVKVYPSRAEWECLGDFVEAGGVTNLAPPVAISWAGSDAVSKQMPIAREWHSNGRPSMPQYRAKVRGETNGSLFWANGERKRT